MSIICNFDDYLGPEGLRRKVGTPAQARKLEKQMAKLQEESIQKPQPAGSVINNTGQIEDTDK